MITLGDLTGFKQGKVRNYESDINRYSSCFNTIKLGQVEKEKAISYANNINSYYSSSSNLAKNTSYMKDGQDISKRFYTGIVAEVAVVKFLGFNIEEVDWKIDTSIKQNKPDLDALDLNVGVKCSINGRYVMIPVVNTYPQIICLKNGDEIKICGLATPEVLNKYQNRALVQLYNIDAYRKGSKTCFYGYNELIKFDTLEELKEILVKLGY